MDGAAVGVKRRGRLHGRAVSRLGHR